MESKSKITITTPLHVLFLERDGRYTVREPDDLLPGGSKLVAIGTFDLSGRMSVMSLDEDHLSASECRQLAAYLFNGADNFLSGNLAYEWQRRDQRYADAQAFKEQRGEPRCSRRDSNGHLHCWYAAPWDVWWIDDETEGDSTGS